MPHKLSWHTMLGFLISSLQSFQKKVTHWPSQPQATATTSSPTMTEYHTPRYRQCHRQYHKAAAPGLPLHDTRYLEITLGDNEMTRDDIHQLIWSIYVGHRVTFYAFTFTLKIIRLANSQGIPAAHDRVDGRSPSFTRHLSRTERILPATLPLRRICFYHAPISREQEYAVRISDSTIEHRIYISYLRDIDIRALFR